MVSFFKFQSTKSHRNQNALLTCEWAKSDQWIEQFTEQQITPARYAKNTYVLNFSLEIELP